ncbi:MAG: hypothetical protein AAB420_01790 [Patescibacteria group bacterium]
MRRIFQIFGHGAVLQTARQSIQDVRICSHWARTFSAYYDHHFSMNCFYHPNKEAVGTCKNCGKGICRDSMVEMGSFLACRENEECKKRVGIADGYAKRAYTMSYPTAKRARIILVFFVLLVIIAIFFLQRM